MKRPGKRKPFIIVLLLLALTAVCYSTYWGNVWYLQDDYITVDAGGAQSFWKSAQTTTAWLYNIQNRYQPVRLNIFCLATHLIPEEYSFTYNFGLHVINVLLLFFLVRRFKVEDIVSFSAAALFSVYGVFKMIESPAGMTGSGLNTFFILATLLSLIRGLESPAPGWSKWAWIVLSYLFYLGLVYSYEVSFPLFATIVFVFVLFNYTYRSRRMLSSLREYLVLLPYAAFLITFYLFFCRQPTNYWGATVVLGKDVFTRFYCYSKYLFSLLQFNNPLCWQAGAGVLLYYAAAFLSAGTSQKGKPAAVPGPARRLLDVMLFGLVWYLASVILFTLNNWQTPHNVMHHHLYLMTAGVSIFMVGVIFIPYHLIPKAKEIYKWLAIVCILPLMLVNSIGYHVDYGKRSSGKAKILLQVKRQIQEYVPDPAEIDAILLKNFLQPEGLQYFQMSSMNGMLLQLFDFKKYIRSGNEVISAGNGAITFKGAISVYNPNHKFTSVNKKTEILYFDSSTKKLVPYYDYIDIEKEKNIHQTKKVRSDEDRSIVNAPLEAILRKPEDFDFLKISFNSAANASEISGSAVIEVNNEAVDAVYLSGDTLFINISRFKSNCKYLFLYLYSHGLSRKVKSISFSKNAHGVFRAISVGNFKKWSAYRLGEKITFDSGAPYVEFIDWYPAEWMHRWSMKEGSKVSVRLPELDANVKRYDLVLKIFTFAGHKDIAVLINNTQVASLSLSGPVETIRIPLEAWILKSNADNIVEFKISGAISPHSLDQKNNDTRVLGIGLVEIGLFDPRLTKP